MYLHRSFVLLFRFDGLYYWKLPVETSFVNHPLLFFYKKPRAYHVWASLISIKNWIKGKKEKQQLEGVEEVMVVGEWI